jgi:hypothetical protein
MMYNTDGDVMFKNSLGLMYNADGDLLPTGVPDDGRGRPYIKVSKELHDLMEAIGEKDVLEILKKAHPEHCI